MIDHYIYSDHSLLHSVMQTWNEQHVVKIYRTSILVAKQNLTKALIPSNIDQGR